MDAEARALERIRAASEMAARIDGKPLVVCYSGGKDSDVLLRLFEVSGVAFEVLHSLTTADAPETVRHVYETFRRLELAGIKCEVDKHVKPDGSRVTMWNLIPRKLMPPTRLVRYCCAELKETGGAGRFIATGIRWAESVARKSRGTMETITGNKENKIVMMDDNDDGRRAIETCKMSGKRAVNPIVDWTDEEVMDYAAEETIPMNPLYCEGFRRVGCIGCPMASRTRDMEFALYPKIKAAYLRAFERMLDERRRRGKPTEWGNAEDVFHWWMEDGVLPGQERLEGFEP